MAIWDAVGSSLLGALVGGALTGYFTIRATKNAGTDQLRQQEENRRSHVKAYLQAVHDEIETLWELYQSRVGVQLEALQDNWALLMYYPVTFDYFTMYTTNGHLLGHVADPDLRRLIVQVYSQARGLLDSYRLNNDLASKVEHWHSILQGDQENQTFKANFDAQLKAAQAYAVKIRQAHEQVKGSSSQLLRQLRQMGAIARSDQG